MSLSRRRFLGVSSSWLGFASVGLAAQAPPGSRGFGPGVEAGVANAFPLHPPALVREMVTVSHGNLARVQALLERWPALSRAAVDWGYGDWEDALGAASHVGNRQTAELLIRHGARPTIFSAAMFGQLDVVKAFIAASPGIEGTHGPHSITLLSHAKAGGAPAAGVVALLNQLPDADRLPATQPLTADELKRLIGTYSFGSGAAETMVVEEQRGNLSVARAGSSARVLRHLGELAFYPVGAVAARVRFAERAGKLVLSVHDPDLVVIAERVS